jgi:membrane-associated phospholipid phosphatase
MSESPKHYTSEKRALFERYFFYLEGKYPRLTLFIQKRLSSNEPYGLYLFLGIATSVGFIFYFLNIAEDILFHSSIVMADFRIMELLVSLRNIPTAKFFLFITYLGNWEIILSLGIIALLVLLLLEERIKALFFLTSVAIGQSAYSALKILFDRPRPDRELALTSVGGYSFPSGHAVVSIIFYGLIAYFIAIIFRKRWQKTLIFISAGALIFLIGLSRMYLGLHWMSDIISGWSLGMAIIFLAVTNLRAREKSKTATIKRHRVPIAKIITTVICLLIVEGSFFFYLYTTEPLIAATPKTQSIIHALTFSDLDKVIMSDNFHKFSETLTGKNMEPMSLIIIGSRDELIQVFNESGWSIAEKWNRKSVLKSARTAILDQPYPSAPVSPSFWNANPENIAFQKATELDSFRQRHHVRFWITNIRYNGKPVWVATASFDEGLKYLVTHRIHPDIDTERDLIKEDLVKTNMTEESIKIQLVPPHSGKNSVGDEFYTDGKAYIIFLKDINL